jgi:hypothetical protein
MTSALLERDTFSWKAHAHIDKFSASSERDAMHILHPVRARLVDTAKNRGYKLPSFFVPHITGDEMERLNFNIIGTIDEAGNLLANAGINRLGSLLIGGGGQAYDATHTAIGVGDTATAAAATDTDLTATVNAANRYFQVADSTYPTFATQVLTVKSTFATGNANFHWQEWGIAQNTASGANAATAPLLNHKIVDLGTKTSNASWAFTVTVTLS